jgi:predicted glycosyltransferase
VTTPADARRRPHRILVDVTHPAHFHFFRPAMEEWLRRGHRVILVGRDKDLVRELLNGWGRPYALLSRARKGLVGLSIELIEHEARLLGVMWRERPQVMTEVAGTFIVHAALLAGVPSLVFYDTEHAKLQNAITYPFATRVITPACYRGDAGRRHVRFEGYKELAYLHPNRFRPDPSVLAELGVAAGQPFFVVRFVSWAASHDVGQRGLTTPGRRRLIERLAARGRVLVSSEGELPPDLRQYRFPLPARRMHDALAFAALFIGEGGTMATEAAMLGTPSIFVSTLESGNWYELRDRYGLLYFYPDEEPALAKAEELLAMPDLKAVWAERRRQMLADKIDVTDFVVRAVESFCEGRPII